MIIYAAINIRLDIIFTIRKLSQYMIDPARHYKQMMKYLIWYLWSIIKYYLIYKASENNQIIGYIDKDYTKNRQNCKLIMEIIFLLGDDPIL